jgi:hypothetical protein
MLLIDLGEVVCFLLLCANVLYFSTILCVSVCLLSLSCIVICYFKVLRLCEVKESFFFCFLTTELIMPNERLCILVFGFSQKLAFYV